MIAFVSLISSPKEMELGDYTECVHIGPDVTEDRPACRLSPPRSRTGRPGPEPAVFEPLAPAGRLADPTGQKSHPAHQPPPLDSGMGSRGIKGLGPI